MVRAQCFRRQHPNPSPRAAGTTDGARDPEDGEPACVHFKPHYEHIKDGSIRLSLGRSELAQEGGASRGSWGPINVATTWPEDVAKPSALRPLPASEPSQPPLDAGSSARLGGPEGQASWELGPRGTVGVRPC